MDNVLHAITATNSTNRSNSISENEDILKLSHSPQNVTKAVFLSVVGFAIVTLNIALWIIVLMKRFKLRSSSNFLLLSLSGADLIVGTTTPVVSYTALEGAWVFSDKFCTLMGFVHMLTFIASVMSLAAISLNRYVSVCHPWQFKLWYTPKRTASWIAGVWLLSAILASPPLLGWCEYGFQPGQSICFATWTTSSSYMLFMVLTCFFGPLSTMIYSFTKIYKERRKILAAIENDQERFNRAKLTFQNAYITSKQNTPLVPSLNQTDKRRDQISNHKPKFYLTVMQKLKLNEVGQEMTPTTKNIKSVERNENTRMNSEESAPQVVNNSSIKTEECNKNSLERQAQNTENRSIVLGIRTNLVIPCPNEFLFRAKSLSEIKITSKENIPNRKPCLGSKSMNDLNGHLQINKTCSRFKNLKTMHIDNHMNSPQSLRKCHSMPLFNNSNTAIMLKRDATKTAVNDIHKEQKDIITPVQNRADDDINNKINTYQAIETKRRHKEEWQLTMSLLLAIISFFICWFPFCIVMFVTTALHVSVPASLDFCSLFLGVLNSSVNPVIYGVMNKRIKNAFRELLMHCFC